MRIPACNPAGDEVLADSRVLDAEAATDLRERGSPLIQTDRLIDLGGGEDVLAPLNPVTVQDRPNRPAVKTEFFGKLPHIATRLVFRDQV